MAILKALIDNGTNAVLLDSATKKVLLEYTSTTTTSTTTTTTTDTTTTGTWTTIANDCDCWDVGETPKYVNIDYEWEHNLGGSGSGSAIAAFEAGGCNPYVGSPTYCCWDLDVDENYCGSGAPHAMYSVNKLPVQDQSGVSIFICTGGATDFIFHISDVICTKSFYDSGTAPYPPFDTWYNSATVSW